MQVIYMVVAVLDKTTIVLSFSETLDREQQIIIIFSALMSQFQQHVDIVHLVDLHMELI